MSRLNHQGYAKGTVQTRLTVSKRGVLSGPKALYSASLVMRAPTYCADTDLTHDHFKRCFL